MYDENLKQQFLEQLDQLGKVRYNTIFSYVEDLEISYDTDIFNMPYETILTYLMKRGSYSNYQSLYDRYTSIKRYKTWALLHDYINNDCKVYVDEKCDLKGIYQQYCKIHIFRSPLELYSYLMPKLNTEHIVNQASAQKVCTIDDMTMALCCLVYQGFTTEEVLNLKISDVKITNSNIAIITADQVVVVYDEFTDLIRKVTRNRICARILRKQYSEVQLGEYLVDNGISDTLIKRKNSFLRIMSDRDIDIKLSDLYYVGKIYHFYQHHNPNQQYKRLEIMDYCFPDGRKTHRKREQFYRILELWNKK